MFWRNFALAMLALLLFACLFGGCATGSLIWVNIQPEEAMPIESNVDLEPLQSVLESQSEKIDGLAEIVEAQGEQIGDQSESIDDIFAILSEPAAPAPQPDEEPEATQAAPPPPAQETSLEECLPGVTTGEAQVLTGISVQRLADECSAFVWRGAPDESVEATCPSGWVCTLDVVDDIVVVHEGVGQVALIHAGTFRQVASYPSGDAVHDVCRLFENERDLGQREDPSFEVRFQPVPGGVQQCG